MRKVIYKTDLGTVNTLKKAKAIGGNYTVEVVEIDTSKKPDRAKIVKIFNTIRARKELTNS